MLLEHTKYEEHEVGCSLNSPDSHSPSTVTGMTLTGFGTKLFSSSGAGAAVVVRRVVVDLVGLLVEVGLAVGRVVEVRLTVGLAVDVLVVFEVVLVVG